MVLLARLTLIIAKEKKAERTEGDDAGEESVALEPLCILVCLAVHVLNLPVRDGSSRSRMTFELRRQELIAEGCLSVAIRALCACKVAVRAADLPCITSASLHCGEEKVGDSLALALVGKQRV